MEFYVSTFKPNGHLTDSPCQRKLIILNNGFPRKRLQGRLQTFAGKVANVCGKGGIYERGGGSVDIPWGIIELVLWRTALQADTYVFGVIRAHLHFVPMYTGYSW